MHEKEKFYDDEIAPALKDLADKCAKSGLSFVAVVEYAPGEIGVTQDLLPDAGLAMVMVSHCAKMGTNIDGYIMGISNYARENKIDTSASMVLQKF